MAEGEADEATLFDSLWLVRMDLRDVGKQSGDKRTSLLSSLLSRLDNLCDDVAVAYLDSTGSKKELHGPSGAAALSFYYRSYVISNYVTSNRLSAVATACSGYFRFLEVLDGYGALDKADEAEVERLRAERSRVLGESEDDGLQGVSSSSRPPPPAFAQALDRRARMMKEFQAEKDARAAENKFVLDFQRHSGPALGSSGLAGKVAPSSGSCPFPAYSSLGDDMQDALYTMYDSILQYARFNATKEIGYLLQEQEMLLFAKNRPEEAERARREYQEASQAASAGSHGAGSGKIEMVSLDSETVKGMGKMLVTGGGDGIGQLQRAADTARTENARRKLQEATQDPHKVHQGGHTVPLDALALIEAGHPDKAIADLPGPADARGLSVEQWKSMDLVYGGGNPYTGQVPGDPSGNHQDMEFRVVKTERFQPGQEESEKDEDKEASDFSDEEALKKEREWDEWKDEHKRGSGNRHNRM